MSEASNTAPDTRRSPIFWRPTRPPTFWRALGIVVGIAGIIATLMVGTGFGGQSIPIEVLDESGRPIEGVRAISRNGEEENPNEKGQFRLPRRWIGYDVIFKLDGREIHRLSPLRDTGEEFLSITIQLTPQPKKASPL